MKILALDTATENCSAALWIDGQLSHRQMYTPRGHADLILSQIDELLHEADCPLKSLDAIAFGRGPGSFTGVRLAASVTQGLAFGAGTPVVAISDLQAVAQRLYRLSAAPVPQRILVCNDARMNEVYWSCFEAGRDGLVQAVGIEAVGPPAKVQLAAGWQPGEVTGCGRGFDAYPELGHMFPTLAGIQPAVLPTAVEIALLAVPEVRAGRVRPPQEALPVYLRNDVARPAGVSAT